MSRQWFREREPAVAEGFAMPHVGQLPMRVTVDTSPVARVEKTGRGWLSSTVRLLRNALIGAVAMAVVPIVVVTVRGDYLTRALYHSSFNVRQRVRVIAEPVRSFGVARDPSITPMQAGVALNELQYRPSRAGEFPAIKPSTRYVRPWRVEKLSADMFVGARSGLYDGPANQTILEESLKGFSPREQAYLKKLAEAPIWQPFDLVARAPSVDVVGGQLRVPFGPEARPEQRPLPSYRDSKELAYAAVSRAAYYMSIGKPHEAEQVLRSVISFGLALIDNGTTPLDELIGTVEVGIGRDALRRFYAIQHDPRASRPELAQLPKMAIRRSGEADVAGLSADEIRQQLIARLADPTVPRPERFETVQALTLMQCTDARSLLFGERRDVRDAIERARNELARYPSERAILDLETRLPSAATVSTATGPLQSLLVSPAMVAGAVLRNPRMGACTLLLTSGQ